MKNHSPIYNMLHQEIKACADHLIEMSQCKEISLEKDVEQVLGRFLELHEFSCRVRADVHYHPLSELKHYLENTMLCYQDDQNHLQSMRLSEAISLLGLPSQTEIKFKSSIVRSLTNYFLRHFLEEAKPGRPLFRKLTEIKKL
jgi:hypothetical protein